MPQVAAEAREIRPVRAVQHALEVLEALGVQNGEVGVSALSRATGLSKTAVYNIVSTLEQRRWVARNPETTRYRLGWRVYELGAELVRERTLQPIARRILESLAQQTAETALLGIRDGDAVLYVDQCESPQSVRMVMRPGRRSPLHATATGKVLLAFGEQDALDELLLSGELLARTPDTITDPGTLRGTVDEVREHGFATCWMENEPHLCSLAVPILDRDGRLIAALGIAGPDFRVNAARQGELLAPLRAAGEDIERRIGRFDHAAGMAG